MSDLIERLRTAARKACERHNRVDQFTPSWERKPKDFIEWEAADEIERLQLELKYKLDQSERIKNLEAEIERLKAVVDAVNDYLWCTADPCVEQMARGKLEDCLAALEEDEKCGGS